MKLFFQLKKHVEYQLRSQLIRVVRERCTDCYKYTTAYLTQGVFLCHDNPTAVTYRSALVNPFPTTTSAHLVGTIQSWVSSAPSLVIDKILLRVSPSCPTVLMMMSVLMQFLEGDARTMQ